MRRPFIVFVLSTVFAVMATVMLAMAAEANHWCCVHGWALMHGSGLGGSLWGSVSSGFMWFQQWVFGQATSLRLGLWGG